MTGVLVIVIVIVNYNNTNTCTCTCSNINVYVHVPSDLVVLETNPLAIIQKINKTIT